MEELSWGWQASIIGIDRFLSIPNFLARAASIMDMTGNRVDVQWMEDAVGAFPDIQQSLSNNAVQTVRNLLFYKQMSLRWLLELSSSRVNQSVKHPMAFISCKLFQRENCYSAVEKEALTIKWTRGSFSTASMEGSSLCRLTIKPSSGYKGWEISIAAPHDGT